MPRIWISLDCLQFFRSLLKIETGVNRQYKHIMPLPILKHPVHKATLPSSGKTVQFRPMVGLEEKILLTARESDDTRDALAAVRQVVNNCVLDVNVSVDDMTTFDLEWLFLQIRSASISNISKVWLVD